MTRTIKIVPVPSAPAKPKEVELRNLDFGTVVEWWRTPHDKIESIVVYQEGYYERGLVDRFDFSRIWDFAGPIVVTPIGRMVNGSFVPDPAPVEELPLVKDQAPWTVVDWFGHPCLVVVCNTNGEPTRLLPLDGYVKCPQTFGTSDRARVLGTLAPVTLADFQEVPK